MVIEMAGRKPSSGDTAESGEHNLLVRETTGSITLPFSTEDIIKGLKSLGERMPEAPATIILFANLLAESIGSTETISALSFHSAAQLLLHDLERGIDSRTNQPITNQLVNMSDAVYTAIRIAMPKIVDATCPPNFPIAYANAQLQTWE